MRESLPNIPVFYSEAMLAETDSFSPSAGKPRHVLSAWRRSDFPASSERLRAGHHDRTMPCA